MNTNLKKLANGKKGVNLLLTIVLALVIVVCLLVLIGTASDSSDSSAEPYTADSTAGERAYVDAQYASEYFASFEAQDEDKLYFILDEEFGAYIVCIPDSGIEPYLALQAYTFGETDVQPAVVRTYGKLVPIDESTLIDLAIEGFNQFWGENVVTEDNFTEIFGEYYLDTAVTDVSGTPYALIAVIVGAAVLMVFIVKKNKLVSGVSRRTLAALEASGETERINGELQDIRTKQFEQIGVYLTENYLVSHQNGLVVLPLAEVKGLYGVVTEKNYELVARDAAETEKTVVKTKNKVNKQWDQLVDLVTAISGQLSGLEYGAERETVEGVFEVTQIPHFFVARNSGSALEVRQDMTNPDGTVVTANYALGVIGSLIGALIGGLLWFLVGNLGYIAGIVGFVIIYLSALGFKKGAKVLTKGGAVISVIISLLTILAANYVLYAWQLTQAFDGRFTFGECLSMLPSAMTEYDLTGSFVKDIAIGYVFTIMAAFSTLKTMFGKKKQK